MCARENGLGQGEESAAIYKQVVENVSKERISCKDVWSTKRKKGPELLLHAMRCCDRGDLMCPVWSGLSQRGLVLAETRPLSIN